MTTVHFIEVRVLQPLMDIFYHRYPAKMSCQSAHYDGGGILSSSTRNVGNDQHCGSFIGSRDNRVGNSYGGQISSSMFGCGKYGRAL